MRSPKFEWTLNINTALQIVTLAGVVSGWIYIWANTERDILELKGWRDEHKQLHEKRAVEVRATEVRYDERMKNVESEIRKLAGVADNLSYRITANEQASSNTSQTVKEIQNSLGQLGGDMRVVREILQRIEASQKRSE